jgi:hypothetical protein
VDSEVIWRESFVNPIGRFEVVWSITATESRDMIILSQWGYNLKRDLAGFLLQTAWRRAGNIIT